MNLALLRSFFLWCTILNAIVLLLMFLIFAVAGEWVHRMHGRWFPLSREAFNTVFYSFLGGYKLLVVFFNLVPWLVLVILG